MNVGKHGWNNCGDDPGEVCGEKKLNKNDAEKNVGKSPRRNFGVMLRKNPEERKLQWPKEETQLQ